MEHIPSGYFRRLLFEGRDLEKVVSKIKSAVLEYRKFLDEEEELFRKDVERREERLKAAVEKILETVESKRGDLEAGLEEGYSDHISPALRRMAEEILRWGRSRGDSVEF